MILPIGDVQKPEKTPYVNYALLGINVFVFLFIQPNQLTANEWEIQEFFEQYAFVPARFSFLTLFFSMFMHGGLWHLIGNMLFLYIAGDNVEDRLGKIGYIFFYLACGVAASMAYFLFNLGSAIPTLGASGAISGVLGAYFLLCPRNQVKFFYWIFFFIGVFYVSARVVVVFYFAIDLIMFLLGGESGIAVEAHIGGTIFGFLVTLALIKTHLASPYLATEHHARSFRKVSPFARDHRGRPFIRFPGSSPYARYSNQRHIFRDEPREQADWLSDSYAAPSHAPVWQQAQTASGLFTVVAQKPIGGSVSRIAPAVASLTGVTAEQAARALRADYGVIARNMPGQAAASLEASLAQFDVTVALLRNEDTIDLPPVQELTNMVPGDAGVTFYTTGTHSLTKRRDEIFLMVCGAVGGVPTMDIYTYEPWTRFRVSRESKVFEHPAPANIRSITARILKGHNIPVNRGVKVLVDGGDWSRVAFPSQEDFDRYCYWLIQVVNARNRGFI